MPKLSATEVYQTSSTFFSRINNCPSSGRPIFDSAAFVQCDQRDQKKSPNVRKSCPKMISLEKWYILTSIQKLPKNVGDFVKLIVAKDFKKVPRAQKNCPIWSHWMCWWKRHHRCWVRAYVSSSLMIPCFTKHDWSFKLVV